MAETYKGLTIRIGGDTTRLQSALRSADSAISNTQRQLRAMTQALKMDPSSASALNRQLELTGRRAIEVNQRLATLKSSLRDISSQRVDFLNGEQSTKTIGQLASETADASKRAAEAKENYNAINGELERLYKSINSAARANEQFGKGFDVREQVLSYGDLRDQLVQTGAATDQQIDRVNELRAAWKGAFEENEIAKAVARVEDLNSEMIKTEASAKQVSRQFADMSRASFSKSIGADLEKELQDVAKAADKVEDRVSRLQKALDVDPGNIETVRLALDTIDEAAANAEDRLDLLRQKVAAMDAQGIGDLAEGIDQTAISAQRAADEYADVTEQVNRCQGEIRSLAEQQRAFESHGDTTSDRYRELGNEIREAESRLAQLVARQRELQASADNGALVQEYREAKVQIAETAAEYQRLKKAQSDVTGFKGLSSQTLMELGMTLSTTVTPAILSFGASAIQSAEEIDSAYRDMRKTVDGTESDFERLRQAAVDFSTTHVTSADQILQIQAIGGELGVATEDLQTFAETVSNLDVATDLDAETAATALGQLDNIMNDLSGATMPQFADALVRLGNNGASTESQIVDIAKRIGSMASIIGMSTPEVLAWASSIASTGQNAEAAGTAISNTMADIESAVASGGDSLMAFAEVSGMSAQEFAAAWESDPSTAMRSFIEGLNGIEEDGGSATATLSDLGITATRQVQAIEGLMQTIGGLDDNLRMSNDAWNGVSDQWGEAGDAANEASKKAEGFSGSLSRLQNMAQVLGSEIGESLVPFIDILADVLGDATEWFVDLPDAVQTFISTIGGMTAAVGPLLLMGRAIGSLKEDLSGFMTKVRSGSGIVAKFANSISGLQAGLIGLGIGAAVTALVMLGQEMEKARQNAENLEKATDGLSGTVKTASSRLVSGARDMEGFGVAAEDAMKHIDEFVDSQDEFIESQADVADQIESTIGSAEKQITSLGQAQSVIEQYANKSGLSATEQGKLRAAIELVNQECGTQYSVVDAANGKIADQEGAILNTTEAIRDYISAMQDKVRVDALRQSYDDAVSAQIDAQNRYAEGLEAFTNAQESFEKKWGDTKPTDMFGMLEYNEDLANVNKLKSDLEDLEDVVGDNDAAVESLAEQIGIASAVADGTANDFVELAYRSEEIGEGLASTGQSIVDFAGAMEQSGYTIEDFNDLTSEEMSQLAENFDGSLASMLDAMDALGKEMPKKGLEAVLGLTEGMSSASESAIRTALDISGMTLEQFSFNVSQFQLTGEDQIAAYARGLSNGNTSEVAAMKAIEATQGLGSYLSQFGIEGQAGIDAFILAIQSGDTWTAALEKGRQAAQGISDSKPDVETAAGDVADAANTNLTDVGDVASPWEDAVNSIGAAIASAGRWAINTAWGIANSIAAALADARASLNSMPSSASGSGGGFSGGGGGGAGGGGGGGFRSAAAVSARSAAAPASVPSVQAMSVPTYARASVPDITSNARGIVSSARSSSVTSRSAGGYAGSVDASRRASTINQYYIGDTSVTTMNDQEFAREFVNLMDRYGRLART